MYYLQTIKTESYEIKSELHGDLLHVHIRFIENVKYNDILRALNDILDKADEENPVRRDTAPYKYRRFSFAYNPRTFEIWFTVFVPCYSRLKFWEYFNQHFHLTSGRQESELQ